MSADGQTPKEDDKEPMMKDGNLSMDLSHHISTHDTLHNPVGVFDDSDSGDSFANIDENETLDDSNDSSSGEQQASESKSESK
jgi:hypothetical protein